MNKNKIIGLIGGMGPFAGARFCTLLLEKSSKIFGAKNGEDFPELIKELLSRTDEFVKKQKLDGIILGCTELPLAFPQNKSENIVDCLDVLSDALLKDFSENRLHLEKL